MLAAARAFFARHSILEVDCPLITSAASVDAHIDLISICYQNRDKRYLHSSPEYGMKRLIAEGAGDIYQLAHVFRDGELGVKHNPEFMMAEWYRLSVPFSQMIAETAEFIYLFLEIRLNSNKFEILSYRDAFLRYAGFDYYTASEEELIHFIRKNELEIYPEAVNEGKDALLNLILGSLIEPQLGKDGLTVLAYYPASQSALARTVFRGEEAVAERFEIYFEGIELCNGFHELSDPLEQRKRFQEANQMRISLGKEPLPIDEKFLAALEKGLPDCCGVAVGFDRLMMLRHKAKTIADVIPFGWQTA
jgi:lysyl-tRNA synthetase class 2